METMEYYVGFVYLFMLLLLLECQVFAEGQVQSFLKTFCFFFYYCTIVFACLGVVIVMSMR